ncbi:MAG TPA: hypothetical protein PLP29_11230 [Candidatus Ozemobacteraceae bacterium]|nr:hypothetical protein [Candidatus Ozemobacteraceae bacterium]
MSALLLWGAGSGFGVDLAAFQGFMRTPAGAPARSRPATLQAAKLEPVRMVGDADASYQQQNQLVTLGNARQGPQDTLSLPPETRVPEGLRPLLTDRKTPRQGVGLSGSTGAQLVPSPGVLEPGKSAVGVHVLPFDLKGINDESVGEESYMDTSLALTYGVMDGFEFGIDKSFGNQDTYDVNEPVFVNMKYQVPGNLTLGGSFCTDSQGAYHSVWVNAGVPVAWVGVGANFGPGEYHFSYNGWDKIKRAKYGGYNYDYNSGKGYADPVFFMVGGAVPISDAAHFIYDFNGDRFSLGFRFNYQKIVYFDASYISDGDYERLPGAIAHKRMRNVTFGGSLVF